MNQATIPLAAATPARNAGTSIGGLLLETGKITPEGAERVLRMQKELGIRFGEAAQRLGLVTEADIQQVLARQFDYPYLQPGEGKYSPQLVAAYNPFSPQVEALRAVRSQLMLRWFARGHKSLVIMSAQAGNGASLFAANLAVVFSQLGEQTLLVDANLRKPRQHEVFNLAQRQGLSDVLAGRADLNAVTRIESFVDLSVLGAGTLPPNPQELLSRDGFTALGVQLESRFDVVLYDVPAGGTGSDALAVAARAGGVLLVSRKDVTPLNEVIKLSDQLAQNGVKIVGSVLVSF
ncbi:chain length determinant protein tyrosine kinase EpsG [Massilia dura]|uniref:Chain length determinant protein tyrosine kinase EpsG n=1 Tax=Pseudoduganella dura TaxID=321982 RepID=A0A6I3XD32_9BURK|nr:chain length determinant protein tyrosine kinase EpsG [Pseudoduganella dura]MUI12083.1 chain length determinant protein tyrosine kinase EpsG [Pseudoduganella dura]GGX82217.1 hypothetical protein GCM10007386_11440 [Pseudoduganella dura]